MAVNGTNAWRWPGHTQTQTEACGAGFTRYCRDLPGAAEFLEPLERLAGASSMAMHSVTSKEMMLDSYKSIRGETDKRSKKRGSWDEHLKP